MHYINFVRSIETLGPYEDSPVIAVAVSGGIDSLALTFLAHEWVKSIRGKVIALTVNHNLRPESLNEAQAINTLLCENNIEHHILNWNHDNVNRNIHHHAREARFKLLTDWCNQNNILHLLLAHHQQDQAETLFINMCRGSGLNGLTGIPAVNIINKIRILRPLLYFSKDQLKEIVLSYTNWWIEDPSNHNLKFMRSYARKLFEFEPLLQLVNVKQNKPRVLLERLGLMMRNLSRVRSYIENESARYMAQIVKIYPQNYLLIDYQGLIRLDKEIALNILASCLMTISGRHTKRPRFKSLERLLEELLQFKSQSHTLWNCKLKAIKDKNFIKISPEIKIVSSNDLFIPSIPLAQKQSDY
jgi:tRNA(Ile)-lysidine synthase